MERIPERITELSMQRRLKREQARHQEFVRGPVPLPWLEKASAIPGRAAVVIGLLLWFRAGATKRQDSIRLPGALLQRFKLSRRTTYNALAALEAAGLVRVERHRGRNPRMMILDVPGPAAVADAARDT